MIIRWIKSHERSLEEPVPFVLWINWPTSKILYVTNEYHLQWSSSGKVSIPDQKHFLSEFKFAKSICGTGHHPSRDLTIAILRMSRIVVRFDPRSINVGRVDFQ